MSNKDYSNKMYFGPYGGQYVPEMLISALDELEMAYERLSQETEFQAELRSHLTHYAGRPTPLYFAENLTKKTGGSKIYLKLEGLAHTGAHKINNVLGQAMLAKKMGKSGLVAETGAGQHGLATATVAAKFGLTCKIFMGEKDIKRQYPNVYAMRLLGAEVVPVEFGTKTLKDAVNGALKYWIEHLADTHYLLGSALGPFPYPIIVRNFQSVIGREVKEQIKRAENRLPDTLVACVGGGSNAIGLFSPFLGEEKNTSFMVWKPVEPVQDRDSMPVDSASIPNRELHRVTNPILSRMKTDKFHPLIPSVQAWIMRELVLNLRTFMISSGSTLTASLTMKPSRPSQY